LPGVDEAPFGEQPCLDDAGDLGTDLGRLEGGCAAGELDENWYRLGLHHDESRLGGRGLGLLFGTAGQKSAGSNDEPEGAARAAIYHIATFANCGGMQPC